MRSHSTLIRQTAAYEPLPADEMDFWRALPAGQQPDWDDPAQVSRARAELARMPALVDFDEVSALRTLLAEVAAGRRQVIQVGDCAEDPADCVPDVLAAKVGLLDRLADVVRQRTGRPVVRAGRIAGQFAKPRSNATERCDDCELPVFRGHAVNSPQPTPDLRNPDPVRMLTCYHASASAAVFLRRAPVEARVWTSHEALLLDYELGMLRRQHDGSVLLSSAHWPWIGYRTRRPDGAHVHLLSTVVNPVACKVGPATTADELLALCRILDPAREPGRLTLIARLGADTVMEKLPALVAAVRSAGHPVIWLCDPMHGNTVATPDGRKTRYVEQVLREVRQFETVVAAEATACGLHLEATPEPVTECVPDHRHISRVGANYTSACDPRLNPEQAVQVAAAYGASATVRERWTR